MDANDSGRSPDESSSNTIDGVTRYQTPGEDDTAADGVRTMERKTRRVPLSYSQKRIWFVEKLAPGRPVLNISAAWVLEGSVENGLLDVVNLKSAVDSLINRHDILRTRYPDPLTPIGEVVEFAAPLLLVDLSDVPPADRSEYTMRILQEKRSLPFDLAKTPPVRTCLVKESDERHVLLVCVHHIAFDGWSLDIFLSELALLYKEKLLGKETSGLPTAVQYEDYVSWQIAKEREWDESFAYWHNEMADVEPFVLPSDYPRLKLVNSNFGVASASLSPRTVEVLATTARKLRASPYILLFASYFVLLHRHTGRNDILVGSPMAERTLPEFTRIIGILLNNLPIRVRLEPEQSFQDLIRLVRSQTLGAFQHHEIPFEKIVESIRREHTGASVPVINLLFNMIADGQTETTEFVGIKRTRYPIGYNGANVDVTLYVRSHSDNEGLQCDLVYDADLYAHGHMSALVQQFVGLVESIPDNLDTQIAALDLRGLSGDEQAIPQPSIHTVDAVDLLDPADPVAARIEELILQHVRDQPEAVAIETADQRLTYASLWENSAKVSAALRFSGVESGDVVALRARRSAEMVIGMIGILRADATILVVDEHDPIARQSALVAQADARFVLPTHSTDQFSGEARPATLMAVDEILRSDRRPNAQSVFANPVAYLSSTSGTTGRPKMVVGPHNTLIAPLRWRKNEFEFTPSDHQAFLSSLGSDACFRDTLIALAYGSTVCIPDPERFLFPGYLSKWITESNCTTANITPALLPVLTGDHVRDAVGPNAGDAKGPSSLRLIFVVGDALRWDAVTKLRNWVPQARLINYYGTTETGQALSWYDVGGGIGEGSIVPIGQGEFNTVLRVLSVSDRECAPYERGEVVFESEYMAEAALASGGQTPRNREAAYRTGDIGYVDSSGNLHYDGRKDRQVKVRGYRVALPEIDTIVRDHPQIENAVSVYVPGASVAPEPGIDGSSDQIVTHVYCPDSITVDSDALMASLLTHVRRQLPSYMLPSAFVHHLSPWPTNANGKPDLASLSNLDLWDLSSGTRSIPSVDHVRERLSPDELERLQKICIAYQKVLKVDVGARDDFFGLGGHSIMAVELFGELATTIGIEIPLSVLFSTPTPLGILMYTRRLDEDNHAENSNQKKAQPAQTSDALVTIRPSGSRPPLFIVHGAGGHVLKFEKLSRHIEGDRPIYGLQARGVDGVSTPHSTIAEMAQEYISAISGIYPKGPVHIAGYSGGGLIAIEVAAAFAEAERLGKLILLDTYCPSVHPNRTNSSRTRRKKKLKRLRTGGAKYALEWIRKRIQFEKFKKRRVRYRELPEGTSPIPYDLREIRLIEAFQSAMATYELQRIVVPVTLIASTEERIPHSEWNPWMSNSFVIHTVSGNHDDFILEPAVRSVAALIDEELARHEQVESRP